MPAQSQTGQKAPAPRIIALTGFMGAGKTSIGRALAALLRWSFVDLDQEIELQQKATIRELFQGQGELRFREIETETLQRMLEQVSTPTVIALGGGTFVQTNNDALLRTCGARIVFLDTPIEEMLQRCRIEARSSGEHPRPLASDPEVFRALYAQRLPHYRSADLTVSTTGTTAEDNARKIASSLSLAAGAR